MAGGQNVPNPQNVSDVPGRIPKNKIGTTKIGNLEDRNPQNDLEILRTDFCCQQLVDAGGDAWSSQLGSP